MTEAKHTPTPWGYLEDNFEPRGVITSKHHNIAHILGAGHIEGNESAKANAAFIVKAVNCHYELVERLKEMNKILSALYEAEPREDVKDFLASQSKLNTAALAKTKGDA